MYEPVGNGLLGWGWFDIFIIGGVVMSGVNKVILIGNLGADPDIRHTPNGTAVANFRIATNEVYTDRNGERVQRTEWHRVVAFGRLAEIVGQYLKKGKQVYVEGRLRTREWEDQNGQRRFTTEIVCTQMVMLGRAGDVIYTDEEAQPEPPEDVDVAPVTEEDDDLPF